MGPETKPLKYDIAGKRIWVAGHSGMVGSAMVRRLAIEDCEILTVTHKNLDLRRQNAVETWMGDMKPDAVVMAAATVGGIHANDSRPAEFLYDNIAIEANIVHAAYTVGVEKLLMLGSACIYPRDAEQPMTEDSLLTGPLEPTNQWYAVAKIVGIKMCEAYRRQYGCDYISAMPNNLYGKGDNFDLENSHVIPALMRKFHEAKLVGNRSVSVWGSGTPLREFLHVDDLADAAVFLMKYYSDAQQVNVGSGDEVTIRELAETIGSVVGWSGNLEFDASRPDGVPRKVLNADKLAKAGWRSRISLREGLEMTYAWFLDQASSTLRGYGASGVRN